MCEMARNDSTLFSKRRSLFSRLRGTRPPARNPEWAFTIGDEPNVAQEETSRFDRLSHGDLLASLERELGRLRVENHELRADIDIHLTTLEKLRANELRYRAAFRSAPVALIEVDGTGRMTAFSRAAITLFGCNEQDLIGKPIWQLVGSEGARTALRELLNGDQSLRGPLTVELRLSDGTALTVDLSRNRKTDERGHTLGWIVSLIDASARAHREAEIRASANAYRDLFELAPVMLLAVDAKTTTILECNFAVVAATGYSREELLDRSIFDLYDSSSLETAAETFRSFLHSGESIDVSLRVRTKQGTIITVLETCSAVADKGGAILACRLAWRPIESSARQTIASKTARVRSRS
jgi:PAS domain S-box-containing protein